MTIVYRAIWEDSRDDIHTRARGHFSDWLAEKGYCVEVPIEDFSQQGNIKLTHEVADTDNGIAHRLILAEERTTVSQDYWRTTLTTISIEHQQWVWVDLEFVSDENFGDRPKPRRPGLVKRLIEDGHAHVGTIRLSNIAGHYDANHVATLANLILSPDRTLPIVVFTQDRQIPEVTIREAADSAADTLIGVGHVFTVTPSAVVRLNQQLGEPLRVYGGAARVYLPGAGKSDDQARRHYYILRDKVVKNRQATNWALSERIFPLAAAGRPPLAYRKLLHGNFGAGRLSRAEQRERIADELLAMSDREVEKLSRRIEQLEKQAEEALDAQAEAEQRADTAESQLGYLQQELLARGARSEDVFRAITLQVDNIDSMDAAVIRVLELPHLDIPESAFADIDELDRDPRSHIWGKNAVRALSALSIYAGMILTGEISMSLQSALNDGLLQETGANPQWFATHESESTNQHGRYRGQRTFPVPVEVNPSGQVYMPAHIKLKGGSPVAPRIHYHDDLRGQTRKFHIGWIGHHLDNASKN